MYPTMDDQCLSGGPLRSHYLVLDNLSSGASLLNANGLTSTSPAGSPYVSAPFILQPGQMGSLVLQFTDPIKGAITYTARVLAGTGAL